jgi:predicted metal-dependent peptidase
MNAANKGVTPIRKAFGENLLAFSMFAKKYDDAVLYIHTDPSGSMGGTFERVLSYIYRNDIEINLIEADTEVKWVENIKSKRKLETMVIKGLGGTILQPAIDLVSDQFNQYNTVVLTDGYCDSLDLSKIKGRVLMISIGVKVPISRSNGKVKQIMVEKEN